MPREAIDANKRHMTRWVVRNKAWLFSGIGVFLLSGLLKVFFHMASPSTRPTATDAPGVVKEDYGSRNGASEDDVDTRVPLDSYTKLFDGYLYYFTNSLRPDSVEHVIGDSLVKEIVLDTFSVDGFGEIQLSVVPYNYASLFREQLGFFDFREAVPPPSGHKEWESYWGSYSDDQKNPVDRMYYKIGEQIRANLRSYFSNRGRLDSFYRAKKRLIIEAIREAVPAALKPRFVIEMDRVIESFQAILSPSHRRLFANYLDVEREYIAARYGYVPKGEVVISFQNVYDEHDGPVKSVYPAFSKGDRLQEKPVDHMQEERLAKAREILFKESPNAKAAAFAYRRYLEGGEELVEGYIAILKDLKASAFAN